eukprot:984601-Pleurochrysis_carterae.AAC.1
MIAMFTIPPRARNEHLACDIHDMITHREEQARRERFREEIRKIVSAANKRDGDVEGFHSLAYKEMAPVDVLGPLMVFRIVCEVDRGLVVHSQRSRRGARESQISEEGSEVYRLLGSLAGSHDLGLAGRESDRGLLLGRPRYGSLIVGKYESGGRVAGRPIGV